MLPLNPMAGASGGNYKDDIKKQGAINRVPAGANGLFQNKYRIKSARRPGYDYAQNGYYFITICTANQIMFFGAVKDAVMILNDSGRLAKKFWQEIPKHFSDVYLDQFCVMPDHIHGLIVINHDLTAPKRGNGINRDPAKTGGATGQYNPMGKKTLGEIIRWYKGRCSFAIKIINPHFAWHSNFHDRIVRDEKALRNIRQYIINNPKKWSLAVGH